jgi:WD40 repeat protein
VRERGVRAAFDDVIWLSLGAAAAASPQALLAALLDGLESAAEGDDDEAYDNAEEGGGGGGLPPGDVPSACAALASRLRRRALLLVADDVADAGVLAAALECVPAGGPSRLLVTTRDLAMFTRVCARAGLPAAPAPGSFAAVPLPPLPREAAAALLRTVAGVGGVRGAAAAPLEALAGRAGATPLSVSLVGGALRTHVEKPALFENALAKDDDDSDGAHAGAVAREAGALLTRLASAALAPSLSAAPDAPTFRAVAAALDASFAPADVEKYALLGALPPGGAAAPAALLCAAWRMPQQRCDALLQAFQAAALLKHDAASGAVRLHDLQAAFAAALLAARGATAAAHAHLLARAAAAVSVPRLGASSASHAWWALPRAGGGALVAYLWEHVPFHLAEAGRPEEACGLLLRLEWLQGTLARRGAAALLAALARPAPARDADCALLAGALRLCAPAVRGADGAAAADALPSQLFGRLGAAGAAAARRPRLAALAAAAGAHRGAAPALHTRAPSLAAPGGEEEALLLGHTARVTALVLLPRQQRHVIDERLLSASEDGTLRLWDARSGACLRVLRGHAAPVCACAALSSTSAASASADGTLRLWNAADGTCERVIQAWEQDGGAAVAQTALALLPPEGASEAADGAQEAPMQPPPPLQRLLVGDAAGGVSLWLLPRGGGDEGDAADGAAAAAAPRRAARALAPPPPQGVAPAPVLALAALSASAAASCHACDDVCVWRVAGGGGGALALLRVLRGHTGAVTCAALARDGRLVTGSWDRTVRVWSHAALSFDEGTAASAVVYEETSATWRRVRGAACVAALLCDDGADADDGAADGLLAGYHDGRLALWRHVSTDVAAHDGGPPARLLRGGGTAVTALAALPRRRAAAGAADGSLRLHDLGARPAPRPHAAEVHAAAALSHGPSTRVATAGADGRLCVWDAASGRRVAALRLPRGALASALARCPDGDMLVGDWASMSVFRVAAAAFADDNDNYGNDDDETEDRDVAAHTRTAVRVTSCGRVTALVALRRGRVAGAGWHDFACVWPAVATPEGAPLACLKGHQGAVTCLLPLPCAHDDAPERLLSAGKDGTLRVWQHMRNDDDDGQIRRQRCGRACACCVAAMRPARR